jgi:hypothetical protein
MAATGIFAETITNIAGILTALGLKPITDPRNARPGTVLVYLPTFLGFNANIADITVQLRILAAPPGNTDATNYLITTADTIMNSSLAVVDGRPSIVIIGGQELPCYDMTCRVAAKRV